MNVKIENSWKEAIADEFEKPYFANLVEFVRKEYASGICYPPGNLIFNAFNHCPFNDVKVVIIGQDPYHEPGQANGLCFSVAEGVRFPPSLENIFKEVQADTGKPTPANGDLTRWVEQGVLLLNATLTVRAHQAGSHQNKGWEEFTDAAIRALATKRSGIVYMLWGKPAQNKAASVNNPKHLLLKAPHPSPLSAYRGFFGCRHFSRANAFLEENGIQPIDWQIENI